jgi:glycosyltransferase involved in cell wall biosynthesis
MNIDNKMVSVIIPCFKYDEFLKEAIDSVLNQTYKGVEIIVIDDCSPNDIKISIEDYITNGLVKFIRLEQNKGTGGARNVGIGNAVGKYIVTLDADDILPPHFIEQCLSKIQDHTCVIHSDVEFIDNKCNLLKHVQPERQSSKYKELHPYYVLHGNGLWQTIMFTKEMWLITGGYSEERDLGMQEDWDFNIALVYHGANLIFSDTFYYYRFHNNNKFISQPNFVDIGEVTKKYLLKKWQHKFDSKFGKQGVK